MYISQASQLLTNELYCKNLYWGHRALHVLQKIFVKHFNEIPSSWGSSAMPCHCTQDLCQTLQL